MDILIAFPRISTHPDRAREPGCRRHPRPDPAGRPDAQPGPTPDGDVRDEGHREGGPWLDGGQTEGRGLALPDLAGRLHRLGGPGRKSYSQPGLTLTFHRERSLYTNVTNMSAGTPTPPVQSLSKLPVGFEATAASSVLPSLINAATRSLTVASITL